MSSVAPPPPNTPTPVHSSLLKGSGSHKTSASDKTVNPILRFYYSFPYALFILVATNEGFLVGLYLLKFT